MNSTYDFSVIKVLRKRLNLTLEKLSEAAGLTYSTTASIEANKSSPSLKTLDALACALQISTGNLISLAENRLVQLREAKRLDSSNKRTSMTGVENFKVAFYDKAKIFRVKAKVDDVVKAMALHEDCNEFCYILYGSIRLTIEDQHYELSEDKTILFDGVLDHSYHALEDCEFITVHIPKDIRVIESLLAGKKSDTVLTMKKKNGGK